MTEAEFAALRRFLKRRSGLHLGPEKRYLAESRLQPVCRRRGLPTLSALIGAVEAGDEELGRLVVEAMATNETLFFRDRATYDTLRTVVLPRLAAGRAGQRRLRIWSAACSTGQEPYSLAMLLADAPPGALSTEGQIIATDLSGAAIARAQAGLYSQFEVQRGLPIRHLLRFFRQEEDGWRVVDDLRGRVQFRVSNLLDDFRGLGAFDLILCRNLLIYLDPATRRSLLERLAGALAPDGVLCLGAAETASGLDHALRPDPGARGFYLRADRAAAVPSRLRAVG